MLLAHGGADASQFEGQPPLTPGRLLSAWEFNPWLFVGVLVLAALYLTAVARLRARGDRWPVGRTVAFIGLGLGTVVVAGASALAVYDGTLFSVHMVQHMLLGMVAPVFLALGAPGTLFLRAWHRRPRALLLQLLHSRFMRVATFPLVGFALYVGSPFALYFTALYEATLRSTLLHELLHMHFLLAGSLFLWPILGVDPVPNRLVYPLRMVLVFASMPIHAFLGIAIMSSSTIIAGDYYRELARPWGASLASDQYTGGGILWGSGDLVALLLLGALTWQWMRAEEREAVRIDRQLDRLEAAASTSAAAPASADRAPTRGAGEVRPT